MQILLGICLTLLMVFSVSLGWYIVWYWLSIPQKLPRIITLIVLDLAIFVASAAVFVWMIWPPLLPL